MKAVRYIAILVSALPVVLKAQNVTFDDEVNLWNIQLGQQATVFAENAYIRSGPSLTSAVTDSLRAGTEVTIVSAPHKSANIRHFYAPWYEITYINDHQKKHGFIWLGLLALDKQTDSQGFQYLFGFDQFVQTKAIEEQDHFLTSIKRLAPDRSLVSSYSYRFPFAGQLIAQGKLLSGMGLENVQHIFRMEFLSEACGVPSDYYYVAWTGQHFIGLPHRSSVGDAGVFYHDEKIQFPSEHRKNKNIIYKYIEDGEMLDEETGNYKVSRRLEAFKWDGYKFTKTPLSE